uniref:Uncharacterized protein n=1 Tax=Sipha flava TaxID=143950 RepID=A0A2S2QSY3_9HEMI
MENRDMIMFRDIKALVDRTGCIEKRMEIIEETCGSEKYVNNLTVQNNSNKKVNELTFNNTILSNELDILRDKLTLVERRMRIIEESNTETITYQDEKYKRLVEKLNAFIDIFSKTPTISDNSIQLSSDIQPIYVKEFNYKIDKLQKSIDTIMNENKLLVQSNNNIVKKMNILDSKLVETQSIGRKTFVHKNNFKTLKYNFNKFKNLYNDLDVIDRLQAIEKNIHNEKPEKLIRKYNKLKMRLCLIENEINTNSHQYLQNMILMSTANMVRDNTNSMANVLYERNSQKVLSPIPALPLEPQEMIQEIKDVDEIVDNNISKEVSITINQKENLLSSSNSNENISIYIPSPPPLPPPPTIFSFV